MTIFCARNVPCIASNRNSQRSGSRLGGKTKSSWFGRDGEAGHEPWLTPLGLTGVRAETAGLEAMHSEIAKDIEGLKKRKVGLQSITHQLIS